MSWVTVIWSMVAAACLTLAAIYGLVWYRDRTAWARLLFSLTAASTTAFTLCELWLMRAETPGELLTALQWGHVTVLLLLVSIIWFVRFYLRAGRLWLAWTLCGLRVFYLLPGFLLGQGFMYREISLRRVPLLGDYVTVFTGTVNPWMLIGHALNFMIVIFVADASVTAWRRGERRQALIVGGAVEFLIILGTLESALIYWAHLPIPILLSPFYLGLVAVMGYELGHDVLRASQLVHELQATELVLRDLSGRLIAAQEVERARIARDLHDDVSQQLAALSIALSGLKRRAMTVPDGTALQNEVSSLQERTMWLSESVRDLSHDLHPDVLRYAGLAASLTSYCNRLSLSQGLAVSCSTQGDFESITPEAALCLYRIAQEALHNVVKHAHAREARVELIRTGDTAELTIGDDGKGFDIQMRRNGAGLGLVSITERARFLKGTTSIVTTLNKGTQIRVRISINASTTTDAGELSEHVAAST